MGVVKLSELEHLAVMFAFDLGASVIVVFHSESKREDAVKMGAKIFISTNNKNWAAEPKLEPDYLHNICPQTCQFRTICRSWILVARWFMWAFLPGGEGDIPTLPDTDDQG